MYSIEEIVVMFFDVIILIMFSLFICGWIFLGNDVWGEFMNVLKVIGMLYYNIVS